MASPGLFVVGSFLQNMKSDMSVFRRQQSQKTVHRDRGLSQWAIAPCTVQMLTMMTAQKLAAW